MRITKQRNNPAAYSVRVDGVEFVAIFETLHNNTNGHPRRSVAISWANEYGRNARAFVITLFYESEQEAAEQLARYIVSTWKK